MELKGGHDVANEKESFSFLLEDVLSFERGQEVGDMITVFLDPDITVQPFHDDVSIRGMIELQGEYDRLQESTDDVEGVWNKETFESRNFVDKVVDIGEERAIFSHQFPVEITIPSYRVKDMDDITMEIENFDYELLSPDQINIQSSILIHGIHEEEPEEIAREVDQEEEKLFAIEQQEEERTEDDATSVDRSVKEQENTSEEKGASAEEERTDEAEDASIIPIEEDKQLHISARAVEDTETEDDSEEEAEEDETVEESAQDRNIDYLKSMFGGEEENGQTKVRLCIVQERDTVDSIAERYDVKKSQILKENRLEDDDVIEGQLLQIPPLNHN